MALRDFGWALLCFPPLVSCSGASEQTDAGGKSIANEYEELRQYLDTPQYGETRPISGKALFGRETSIIGVCESKRDSCKIPMNVDGLEQPCWLVFSKQSSADVKRLSGDSYGQDGEYWIDGFGRIAVRPGGFGHLNGYTCQVELSSVRAFESGPPHFWEPPPPHSSD
jgi:hypothetical protein